MPPQVAVGAVPGWAPSAGALVASGASFYFAQDGDNGNDGLTTATPKKDLSQIAGLTLAAGDRVLLNRGDTWRETLTAAAEGVRYGAYGTGDQPVVSGANLVTGLEQDEAATEGAGELASLNFDAGNLSEFDSTSVNGSVAIAASTDQARSGTHSYRVTGDSTDNRALGIKNLSGTMASGDTFRFFLAIYAAAGQLKNSSEWRIMRLRDGGTSRVFVSLFTNGSGNVASLTVNGHATNAGGILLNGVAVSNWTMGAWNTVEVAYKVGTSDGGAQAWVNGVSVGSSGFDDNTSGGAGIDQIAVGNDAFGGGMVNGGLVYFDDIKVSESPISVALQSSNPHIWSGTLATEPTQVFIEGTRGLRVATAGEVTGTRYWHWASNTLTLYAPTDDETHPLVEASVRDYCANVTAANVTVSGIAFDKAAETGVNIASGGSGSTIDACAITNAFIEGYRAGDLTARTDLTITGCTVSGCGGTGIQFAGALDRVVVTGNTITACCQLHHQLVGASERHQWSAGFKMWHSVSGEVGAFLVSGNTITDLEPQFTEGDAPGSRGVGIWFDNVLEPTERTLITGNLVARTASWGIYLEKTYDHDVIRNRVVDCGTVLYRGGICVESNNLPAGDSNGNRVLHNTVVGGFWALALNRADGGECRDNEFRNNIAIDATEPQRLYVSAQAANDTTNSSGNVFSHNLFGPNSSNMINWGGTQYSTIAAWEAAVAAATNHVVGDPLLVDPPDDLTLGTGSPAIDAGEVIAGVNDGYLGAAPDLGYAEAA